LKCLTRPTGTDGPTNLGGSGATPILKTISSSSLQVAQKKTERLHLKIDFLTRFVNARKMASSDFTETIKICRELLNNEPREAFALAVRIGDVYGLMIEGYFVRKENEKAKEVLREMICSVPEDSIKYCKS
jgi:hypothetical protein